MKHTVSPFISISSYIHHSSNSIKGYKLVHYRVHQTLHQCEKYFIWPMVSRVAVYDHLASLSLGLWQRIMVAGCGMVGLSISWWSGSRQPSREGQGQDRHCRDKPFMNDLLPPASLTFHGAVTSCCIQI